MRKCIKYYADSYLGYIHNGFDYCKQIKKMLTLRMRFFIMISIQYPFLLNKETVQGLTEARNVGDREAELNRLLHVALVLGKSKMEKSLMYVTKALSEGEF